MERVWRYSFAAIVAAIATVGLCAALDHVRTKSANPTEGHAPATATEFRQPLTMRQIFDSDFPGILKIGSIQRAAIGDAAYEFPCNEYIDTATNSFFFAFYIDAEQQPIVIADLISVSMEAIAMNYGQIEIEVTTAGSTRVIKNSTMRFSGQVYLIYAGPLNIKDRYGIEKLFDRFKYEVNIYDAAYYALHWNEFDRAPREANKSGVLSSFCPRPSPEQWFA